MSIPLAFNPLGTSTGIPENWENIPVTAWTTQDMAQYSGAITPLGKTADLSFPTGTGSVHDDIVLFLWMGNGKTEPIGRLGQGTLFSWASANSGFQLPLAAGKTPNFEVHTLNALHRFRIRIGWVGYEDKYLGAVYTTTDDWTTWKKVPFETDDPKTWEITTDYVKAIAFLSKGAAYSYWKYINFEII